MSRSHLTIPALTFALACIATACRATGSGGGAPAAAPAPLPPPPPIVLAPGAGVLPIGSGTIAPVPFNRLPVTPADIEFMSGMIPHHAQAVLIAGWAETHGARSDVQILAKRIIVAQRDEIRMMQEWLRDNKQPVPDSNATHHRMVMNGVAHDMLMPGMLSAEQLAQLDKARGSAFDRLFLTYMIAHHEGAIDMVKKLFEAPGAAQDEIVFRFASDVEADQSTEIHRMSVMLAATPR